MGTTDNDPRWQECLSISNLYLGMPFSLLYVDETFEGESKKSVRKSGNWFTAKPSAICQKKDDDLFIELVKWLLLCMYAKCGS